MDQAAIAAATIVTNASRQRIKAIDGLRGLSIILVLLYHLYSRWADLLPWAGKYRYFIVFEHGGLGVNLFFMISGFVIFMTLQTCESLGEFLYRRWIRLFPAMFLATALIYVSAEWLPERPVGALSWTDTLPGLLLCDPLILNKLTSLHSKMIEGAFWSIFVEVKFYLVFGALYFARKERAVLYVALVFFATYLCVNRGPVLLNVSEDVVFVLKKILSFNHMGWFLIGTLLYQAHSSRSVKSFVFSMGVLPFAILADSGNSTEIFLVCGGLYAVFVGSLYNRAIATLFSTQFFLLWGFISYPLYLIHQNIAVALTIKAQAHYPRLVGGHLSPLPGLCCIVVISWLIARYGEPLLRGWLSKGLRLANGSRLRI